jgi:hypothetical protein
MTIFPQDMPGGSFSRTRKGNIMTPPSEIAGPVSVTSENHDASDAVMQAAAETIAQTPAGPTLIDEMSDEDFLAGEAGNITVGKLKAG